MKSGLTT